jgi:hypothetical protein
LDVNDADLAKTRLLMRHFSFWVTLVVMLLATGVHAQTPPPPAPVAEYNPASWKEFISAEGGFSVSMPGVPAANSSAVETELGGIVIHLYVLTTKLGEYGVSYADLPMRTDHPALIKKILDGSRDEVLANGASRLNETDIVLDGIVGRELILEKNGLIGRHRMFFVDGRLYAVIFATPPNVAFRNGQPSSNPGDRTDLYEQTSARFFGSFKFTSKNTAASLSEQKRAANDAVLDPVAVKTDLYPANADATKEIGEALKLAATDHKRVLLVFGANWCYDCHVLDRALHDGAAGKIVSESFVLVHVDIGEVNRNLDLAKQYKIPLEKGVPAVAILGSDGKLLYGSHDGEFEAARKMMKKDLVAFLKRWKEAAP